MNKSEVIVVNNCLRFVVTNTDKGPRVLALDECDEIVNRKFPCHHPECLVQFIVEETKKAVEVDLFESRHDQ